jgi:hypothetical protein
VLVRPAEKNFRQSCEKTKAPPNSVYKGDEGSRKLQIASSLEVPISDNGKKIFERVTNAGRLELNPPAPPHTPLGLP